MPYGTGRGKKRRIRIETEIEPCVMALNFCIFCAGVIFHPMLLTRHNFNPLRIVLKPPRICIYMRLSVVLFFFGIMDTNSISTSCKRDVGTTGQKSPRGACSWDLATVFGISVSFFGWLVGWQTNRTKYTCSGAKMQSPGSRKTPNWSCKQQISSHRRQTHSHTH